VLDRRQANQTWAAKNTLQTVDIPLFQNKTGTGVRKVHHKLMVLDDAVTIIGSFNYTGPANLVNDENIVVIGDHDTEDAVQIAAQKQIADYARAEIQRIITDQSEPILT
ncbi:MAG: phospholipase D-like domain-containing protein, partial [Pseudomonadota bacterium]